MASSARVAKDETVVCGTRLHWAIYLFPGLWSLVLVGVPWLVAAAIRDATTEFTVTNRRAIVRTGLFFRESLTLRLDQIAAVEVKQGWLGRLLDYGTLVIVTHDARRSYPGVARPNELRRVTGTTLYSAISTRR